MVSFWIFEHLFKKDFSTYSDVDPNLAHTPFTTGDFDTEIKLTKDKDGNWLISQEDYRNMIGEMMDTTEGYSTIERKNSTQPKKKSVDESSNKSTEKSTDKKENSNI